MKFRATRIAAALLLAACFSPSPSFGQSVFSSDPKELDVLRGQLVTFYVAESGRKYIKVFSCAETAIIERGTARLPCEGGIGENWYAQRYTRTDSPGMHFFMIFQEVGGLIPNNTYVYLMASGGPLYSASYMKTLPNGFSEQRAAHLRWLSVETPKRTAESEALGTALTRFSLDPDSTPYFNTVLNLLTIDTVQVGINGPKYKVTMSRVPADDGSYIFRVNSASQK